MHTILRTDLDDAHILRNMADHLRYLSEEVARIALTVSAVTAHIPPQPSTSVIQNLQKIDTIQQSLTDLAQLSDAMACQSPIRDAALQELKLAVTRALLNSGGNSVSTRSGSGSVDLF